MPRTTSKRGVIKVAVLRSHCRRHGQDIADVADKVIPKPIMIAPGKDGATLTVRYFMPHDCHPALAITRSVALASACATPGTLAEPALQAKSAA